MKNLLLKIKNFLIHFENRVNEISDWTAEISANPWFLIFHIFWWALWIGYKVEPFPYGLLTLIVSLEAIALSSLLLSSGNREGAAEKRIARKTLNASSETNMMTEEILESVRDMSEKIDRLWNKEGE